MSEAVLVVNMRGMVNASRRVRLILNQLHIARRFRATILFNSPTYQGMLKTVKDRVAWCRAEPDLIEMLLQKRGRRWEGKPLDEEYLTKIGYNSRELAEALAEGKAALSRLKGLRPFFALSPPRGGFKRSSRRAYSQGGILGANLSLPDLVKSML